MPKYLTKAIFTPEGLRGLREGGAVRRKEVGSEVAVGMGGSMEAFYYAFGDCDAFGILDLPDDEAAAALSAAANEAGGVKFTVTKLLTPEQMDEALSRQVAYRAPGHE